MRIKGSAFLFVSAALLLGCQEKAPDRQTPANETGTASTPLPETTSLPDPFPEATAVRLFVVTAQTGTRRLYAEPRGRQLSIQQRRAMEAQLFVEPIPDTLAACFIPHHFFRYYSATGKELGEIAVCFCCSGVSIRGSKTIKLDQRHWVGGNYDQLGQQVKAMGLPTDAMCKA